MDALCVSVIPNYWTLPFKASLRCISHFCLSDWWRAGSDWGHCVLNTASPVIQYLLQLQYCQGRSCSAAFFHYNFLDLYSLSGSVIKCIVSLNSGLLQLNAKKMKQTNKQTKKRLHMFFKEVFKATKYTTGNRLHFDTEQCRCIQYLGASWKCIQSRQSLSPLQLSILNIFRGKSDG